MNNDDITEALRKMEEAYVDEEHGYDGSAGAQKRELTVKERDVLCRIITRVLHDPAYANEELNRLQRIRAAINPREE